MNRHPFVLPMLAWMILGGCASESDVRPTVSTAVQVSSAATAGPTCKGTADMPDVEGFVAYPVGMPVTITMKSENVTQSCRCEYTAAPQWGCGGQECESEYDLGGENPMKCDRIAAVPADLPAVKPVVDRAPDCSVVVTVTDFSESSVTVTCTTAGPANVAVAVDGKVTYFFLLFTDDGACPVSVGDADAGADAEADADASADASADAEADATDGGAASDAAPE